MSLFGLFGSPDVEKLKSKKDVQGLIKILNNDFDHDLYIRAIKALGELQQEQLAVGKPLNYEVINKLRACMYSYTGEITEEAFQVLVKLKDADGLIGDWNEDEDEGILYIQKVIKALGELQQEQMAVGKTLDNKVVDKLTLWMFDYTDEVREEALQALLKFPPSHWILDALNFANIEDRETLHNRIVELARSKGNEIVNYLKSEARSYYKDYRDYPDEDYKSSLRKKGRAIIEILVEIGDPSVIEYLIDYPAADGDYILDAIANFGEISIEPLIKLLTEHPEYRIYNRVSLLLEKIGKPTIPHLSKAFHTDNNELRRHISLILAYMNGVSVGDLIPLLKDSDSTIRETGIHAIGKIGDKSAIQYLIAGLGDENDNVRSAAAEELEKLGWQPDDRIIQTRAGAYFIWQKTIGSLVNQHRSYNPPTKEVAEKLENICNAQSIPVLISKAGDGAYFLPITNIIVNVIQKIIESEPSQIDDKDLRTLGNLDNLDKKDFWVETVEVDELDPSSDEYRSLGTVEKTDYRDTHGIIDTSKIRELANRELERRNAKSK